MMPIRHPARAVFVGFASVLAPVTAQQVDAAAQPSILDFMLPVDGGPVVVGRTAKELHRSLEIVNPYNEAGRIDDGRRFMAELGRLEFDVDTFLMSRNLVTMEQYKIFVEQSGHRFPFDWWRYAHEDDYNKRLRDINDEFKEAGGDAPIEYWKAHWKELPYSIPKTLDGEPMDHYPVVYVSWRDAVAFAAWAGMRLPTEAEWIRAASGGTEREFVWGDDLSALPVKPNNRTNRPLPVGAHGDKTRGPFGHEDMVLHVFEWVGDTGFFPFDQDAFDKERKRFLSDSLWRKLAKKNSQLEQRVSSLEHFRPEWRGSSRIAKGGWYGSTKEQLRIGLRAPQADYQVRQALGFRVAKSFYPARDMSLSAIKLDYDMSYFGQDREPNLNDQIGVEHYRLQGGLVAGYRALSIVPLNFMEEKKPSLEKYKSQTKERPIVIGTLVVTEKLTEPDVDHGTYTVCYREDGVPNELSKAWRQAYNELSKAKKGKTDESGDEPKEQPWRKTLKKFGLTEEDVLASKTCQFIRLLPGNLEVPVEDKRYILRDNLGNYVASWPTRASFVQKSGYENATVEMKSDESTGLDIARFEFGVPTDPKARGRVYLFELDLKLDWP